MILGLAAAGLTAVIMLLIAITGSGDADNALILLVVGGVILLVVGLAMIALAVWPDGERDHSRYEYEEVTWGDWLANLFGGSSVLGAAQTSRYDRDAEWTIPGWEPPETLEQPTVPMRPEARRPEPRLPRERRATERPRRPQLSKYD